jgi:nicotinamide-nucleotide amidase
MNRPTAEIIAIGSELLTPTKTDTNSLWLTERLNEVGIEVKLKTVVGDDPERLEEAVRDALKRADVIITTGGLGPTEDDVTRKIVARSVGLELEFRQDLEDGIRARFKSFGREMPEINRRQAYIVKGAEALANSNGTAPGMLVSTDGRLLVVLPGPPRELKPMFSDHVIPVLAASGSGVVFRKRVLKVSGLGESAIDEAIAPIYKTFQDITTGILFNKSEVEVHLTAQASTGDAADARNDELVKLVVAKLGDAVFSTEGEEMESVVGRLLRERGETLAVAESCTGGLIGSRITEVAGSSEYFLEGVVTYANSAKVRMLGVDEGLIAKHGAVSQEVAEAMAAGMLSSSGADYAVSVTGIAGPGGGSEEKPVGTVFVGYADIESVRSTRLQLPGDRYLIRWRASQAALDILRRQILRRSR